MKIYLTILSILCISMIKAQDLDTCSYYLFEKGSTLYKDMNGNHLNLNNKGAFQITNTDKQTVVKGNYTINNDTLSLLEGVQRSDELCIYYSVSKSDSTQITWVTSYTDDHLGSIFTYPSDSVEILVNNKQYMCPPGSYNLKILEQPIELIEIPLLSIYDFKPKNAIGFDISFVITTYNYNEQSLDYIHYKINGDSLTKTDANTQAKYPLKFIRN